MATNTLPASRHAGSPSGEEVLMGASARELIEEDSVVHGVRYRNRDGLHEVRCLAHRWRGRTVLAHPAPAEFDSDPGPFVGDGPRGLSVRTG